MKLGGIGLTVLFASLWFGSCRTTAQDRFLEPVSEASATSAPTPLAPKSGTAKTGETPPGTPEAAPPEASEITRDGDGAEGWLPRFRRIFFYDSNAPRLIPANFWPVSLDDLEAALLRESTPGQPGEERPQLASAVYVARFEAGALVSDPDASMLDLTYRDDAPGQISLGPMNLAIEGESATAGAPAQSPRLVTMADGAVRAIVYQDCRLRFGWSRRGVLGPDGSYAFDLRIPPCGRTRFVVGMPEGARLESLDGVSTAYPSPPQEAHGLTGETELTWYGIEAGGLSRLRLIVRPGGLAETPRRLSIRQLGFDYAATPQSLQWTARLVVDVPRGQSMPQMTITDGGRVTSVRIQKKEVRWKETTEGNETRLQMIAPPLSASLASVPVSFEIAGTAPLGDASGNRQETLRLPQVCIADCHPRLALAQTAALLRVARPLRLVEFVDAEGWSIDDLSEEGTSPAEQVYRITGPPSSNLPAVRLATPERWPEATAALRFAVFPNELRARWDAAIQMDSDGPQPLQFEFEPGWQIDTVLLRSSGRIIELPGEAGDGRSLTVWPEAADLVDGMLRVQITGHRGATRQGDLDTVPATWFTRLRGAAVRCVAAVVPLSEFDWVSGTALRGRRIKADQLSADFAEMIGPVVGDTLLFDTDDGSTPELQLRQPPPVFGADLHLDLRLEENEVVERLRIVCRLPAGRLPRLRVRLGVAGHRPPMQWSLESGKSEPAASREPFSAERVDGEAGETWELSPPGVVRDQWVIIGRRRYPLRSESGTDAAPLPASVAGGAADLPPEQIVIPLPTVPLPQAPQASSQKATVSIGPRLSLLRTDGPVLRIPKQLPGEVSEPASVGSSSVTSSHPTGPAVDGPAVDGSLVGGPAVEGPAVEGPLVGGPPTRGTDGWLLRYDASNESSLVLRVDSSPSSPSVVWDERIEVLSGIGGGDRIRAAYRLDGPRPLELRFDPSMVVTAIEGDRLAEPSSEPGRLRIAPTEAGGWVHVDFWRPPLTSRLMRKFRAPLIETSAVVLRRSWWLWAAPDTLAVAASSAGQPPAWMGDQAGAAVTAIGPGQTVWLARSGFAWAAGGTLALFLLGASWWLIRITPWLIIAPFIGFSVIAALTPLWAAALAGFVLVPMAAAALWASVWSGFGSRDSATDSGQSSGWHSSGSATRIRPPSATGGRLSPADPLPAASLRGGSSRLGATWLIVAIGAATIAHAETPPAAELHFPVMIPVTDQGEFSGDKVYIPRTIYDSLFRPAGGQQDLGEIQFQSATYQVRVTPSADSRIPDSVVVEATWRVEIEPTTGPVRLPIDPAALDRLEVVVDAVPNEIRPRPDGTSVLIRPPRAGLNILRASLSPKVEITAAGGVCRFELGIPAVARASLSVSSDSPLTGVSLPNCFGQIKGGDAGSRVTASLGPVTDFVLLWQHGGGSLPRGTDEVRRRWWVHAGAGHTSRELEIEIGDVASSGAIIELTGDNGSGAVVTSPDWMLQGMDDADPPRSTLRLVSMVESPGSIRLLWSEPQTPASSGSIELPDIRPRGLVGGLDTTVAVDVPEGWSVEPPLSGEVTGMLEAADFFQVWQGFRGAADSVRHYRDASGVTVRVAPPPERTSRARESHQVVVAADHLRTSYRAVVQTAGDPAQPVRLLLPPEMRIESLGVNGEPIAALVVPPSDNVLELLLPQPSAFEPTEIQVVGTVPVSADKLFSPPRVRLTGVEIEDSRYQMFRGDQLRVLQVAAPPEPAEPGDPIDYDLTAGTVPLQSWILPAGETSTATRLAGRYQIKDVSSHFTATTLTTLRWEDGLWTMEATIDIEDFGGSTDFLTVEIPTRWIEGLNVEPAAKWSSQPAIDPASQLIRILPQSTSVDRFAASSDSPTQGGSDIRVRITSTLENAGEGGISVPSIRLLGEGPRQRYFSPPRRLTNTKIEWQTRNARWASPPATLQDVAPPPASHLFYEIEGESFSATLRQADSGSDAARCTLLDVALFPRDESSILSLMRWDLLPGNRDQVQFAIPPGARVLGTWSSGTPTEARPDDANQVVTVPVGLSRLAQQIVLLVALPIDTSKTDMPLPHLMKIPVAKTWVASYDNAFEFHAIDASRGSSPTETSDETSAEATGEAVDISLDTLLRAERLLASPSTVEPPWQQADTDAYRRALGGAMMDALDASVDNVAERPTAEKRQWLRPWFARLHELGWPGLEPETSLPASAPLSPEVNSPAVESELPTETVWTAIDAWAPRFLQRVLGGEFDLEVAAGGPSDATWWIPPPSWSASQLLSAPGGAKTIPASLAPRQVIQGDPAVRLIRVAWLGLWAWIIAAVSLRLIGASYLMRPAIWLAILGLLSLTLVPLPLSIAMCGVALASPLLGRR